MPMFNHISRRNLIKKIEQSSNETYSVTVNVPKGTKLYSPIFGEVEFGFISPDGWIKCYVNGTQLGMFYPDGTYSKNGECMLFPSRENRDWDNFYVCPFKRGDFIVKECLDGSEFIAIFSHVGGPYEYTTNYLCLLRPDGKLKPNSSFGIGSVQEARLATEKEKKELLDAIAKNGYYWDECSMTLGKITKFNINSLKPFDRVLARDRDNDMWHCDLLSNIYVSSKFRCVSTWWNQCIPYNDDTKHLIGTNQDCPDYYKTW